MICGCITVRSTHSHRKFIYFQDFNQPKRMRETLNFIKAIHPRQTFPAPHLTPPMLLVFIQSANRSPKCVLLLRSFSSLKNVQLSVLYCVVCERKRFPKNFSLRPPKNTGNVFMFVLSSIPSLSKATAAKRGNHSNKFKFFDSFFAVLA